MTKRHAKQSLRQRSAWIASMVACFAFLLMAVKVYQVSVPSLLVNALFMLLGLLVIIALACLLGWLLARHRERKK